MPLRNCAYCGAVAVQRGALAGQDLLRDGAGVDDRLAFAYGELRVLAIGRDVDAIQARPGERDLAVRRVDARRFARVQHANPQDHATLGDVQREVAIVQPR